MTHHKLTIYMDYLKNFNAEDKKCNVYVLVNVYCIFKHSKWAISNMVATVKTENMDPPGFLSFCLTRTCESSNYVRTDLKVSKVHCTVIERFVQMKCIL